MTRPPTRTFIRRPPDWKMGRPVMTMESIEVSSPAGLTYQVEAFADGSFRINRDGFVRLYVTSVIGTKAQQVAAGGAKKLLGQAKEDARLKVVTGEMDRR